MRDTRQTRPFNFFKKGWLHQTNASCEVCCLCCNSIEYKQHISFNTSVFNTAHLSPIRWLRLPYSAKRWRWKTLANLANRSELAKVLPTKVLPTINNANNVCLLLNRQYFFAKVVFSGIRQCFAPPTFRAIRY